MRYRMLVLALVAGACAKADDAPVDSPATAAVVPATISLADVAGRWTATARPETADTTVVNYEFTATADPSTWTITLPGRPQNARSMRGPMEPSLPVASGLATASS